MPDYKGDDNLSSFDHNLWSLHQHLILNFNCYTVFKNKRFNIPLKQRGCLIWLVPADHPLAYEVMAFLERELASERRADAMEQGTFFPGQDVDISLHYFSGITPYMEKAVWNKLAVTLVQQFKRDMIKYQKSKQTTESKQEDTEPGHEKRS